MPMMSQAEYARHRGVSREAVRQAVKAGRVKLTADGQLDVAAADASWGERSRARTRTGANGRAGVAVSRQAPKPPPAVPPAASGDDRGEADYFAERARRERAEADMAEQKAAEMAGSLIKVDEVRRRWAAIAGEVRTALLQLPTRLAPILAQRDLPFIRQTLDDEIRSALEKVTEESA